MTKGIRPPYGGYHKYDGPVARTYDQTRQHERHWIEEARFIEQYFRSRSVSQILDIPVGTGRFLRYYRHVDKVIGVDISDEMLAEAAKKVSEIPSKPDISLERGDVFALRFHDLEFDVVVVVRLLHLIPPELLSGAVEELCRVGREIIVQTYAKPNPTSFVDCAASSRTSELFSRIWRRVRLGCRPQQSRRTRILSPWSHIEAFGHNQDLVDALFDGCGFTITARTTVDEYDGGYVNFTVYSRTERQTLGR